MFIFAGGVSLVVVAGDGGTKEKWCPVSEN